MEAFENIDDLFRGLQHFLNPYTIYISIFALLCLAGAIVFFCMYRSWKSAWKTDVETTKKRNNADLADLRAENKTWKESSNQLKNELKRLEVANLKAINGLLDKINELKERYHTSCDKGVEQLNQIDDLRDQLAKSENRIACSEGEYSKVNTKLIAMDYAVDIFKKMDVEETLEEIFDGIYSRIKKD
jgi:chromosome segregation ATPase